MKRAESQVDSTQSLSFLLVIERLERARCASEMRDRARDWSEQGRRPRGEWAVPLARSSLSITVDEKRKELRAV